MGMDTESQQSDVITRERTGRRAKTASAKTMSKSKSRKRVESTMDVTELMNLLDKNRTQDQSERGQEMQNIKESADKSEEAKQEAAYDRLRELTAERRAAEAKHGAPPQNQSQDEEPPAAASVKSEQGQLDLPTEPEPPKAPASPVATEVPRPSSGDVATETAAEPHASPNVLPQEHVKNEPPEASAINYKRAEPVSHQPDAAIPSETREAIDKARKISTPSETTGSSGKTPHAVSAEQWQQMLQAVKEERQLASKPEKPAKTKAGQGSPQTRAVKWGLRTLLTFVIVSVVAVAFIGLLYVIDRKADEWAAESGQMENAIAPAAGPRYQAGDILPEPANGAPRNLPKPQPVQIPISPTAPEPQTDPLLDLLTNP